MCLCVNVCSDVLGPLSLRTSGYASSGTSAFSLLFMPSRPAAGVILTHSGSSAAPPPPPTLFHGPISFTYPCPIQFRPVFAAKIVLDTALPVLATSHSQLSTGFSFPPLSPPPTIRPSMRTLFLIPDCTQLRKEKNTEQVLWTTLRNFSRQ